MNDNKKSDSIKRTRSGFEQSFKEGNLYNKQTQDEQHLNAILDSLNLEGRQSCKLLDLGTGSGYLAFEIAKRFPHCQVIGLDIVEQTLETNRKKAQDLGLNNITFVSYDGTTFPFEDGSFDYVTTRYALHHFPAISDTFAEINRVLCKKGRLFLSDPTPNHDDRSRFVDDYMNMKKDGHIKYYTKNEFTQLAKEADLRLVSSFASEITFPRLKETAIGFDEIMKKHPQNIIDGYKVYVTEDGKYIYTTQNVLNLTFEK